MISHAECDHPSTPGARAKCRRARAGGKTARETQQGGHTSEEGPRSPASSTFKERNTGTTPKDRALQCDVCGVERIMWRGTDILTGLMLYVGGRCFYMVKRGDPILIDKRA